MLGIFKIRDRNLMRAPGPLDRQAIDKLRSSPALGRLKHNHWPSRSRYSVRCTTGPRGNLYLTDLRQDVIQRRGKTLMHQRGIVAFNEMRIVAVAAQQLGQFLSADPGQHRWIGDLKSVQMKDWKYGTIARGIEKLVRMPTGGERTGFSFSVTDDATDNQIGVVEGGPIGMGERIAEFAAFMNRTGRFRCDMAWNAVGPGK